MNNLEYQKQHTEVAKTILNLRTNNIDIIRERTSRVGLYE